MFETAVSEDLITGRLDITINHEMQPPWFVPHEPLIHLCDKVSLYFRITHEMQLPVFVQQLLESDDRFQKQIHQQAQGLAYFSALPI